MDSAASASVIRPTNSRSQVVGKAIIVLEAEGRIADIPALEEELKRENYRKRYGRTLRSTIYMLITVAAVAVLVATLWLPVLKIYGGSMTPTLANGEIVVSVKDGNFTQGDIIAFYYNNKILVKRVIAQAGDCFLLCYYLKF